MPLPVVKTAIYGCNINMNGQEIQYLLQIMNNADIKGQNCVFHAQLMSKLTLMLKDEVNKETLKDADI